MTAPASAPPKALVEAVYVLVAQMLLALLIRVANFSVLYLALPPGKRGISLASAADLLRLPFTLPFLLGEELVVATAVAGLAWLALRRPRASRLVPPLVTAYLLLQCVDQLAFKEYFSHLTVDHWAQNQDISRLSTSIAASVDWTFILLTVAAGLLAAPLLRGRIPGLASSLAVRLTTRPRVAALLAIGYVGATALIVRSGPQAGFERTLVVELASTVFPAPLDDTLVRSSQDWQPRSLIFGTPKPPEDFSALHRDLASRPKPLNVVYWVAESTAYQVTSLVPGARYNTTPFLAQLADSALLFDRFYAVYPASSRSNFSTATGIYPYGRRSASVRPFVRVKVRTLSDVLHEHGYSTALFASTDTWYDDFDAFLRRHSFDEYFDSNSFSLEDKRALATTGWGVPEEVVIDKALQWVDVRRQGGRPFFLQYIATYPHHPYGVPEGHDRILKRDFGRRVDGRRYARYRASLYYADTAMRRLYEGLQRLGVADDTLFIVIPDHGESLGKLHRTRAHATHIWEEQTRMFALFANPTLFARPVRSSRPGSQVDFLPTLLELLRIDDGPATHGQSLVGADYVERPLFFQASRQLGLLDGDLKYAWTMRGDKEHLYDLSTDPDEQVDVAAAHADKLGEYKARVTTWRSAVKQQYRVLEEASEPASAWDDAKRDLRRASIFGERRDPVREAFACPAAQCRDAVKPKDTPVFAADDEIAVKIVWDKPGSYRVIIYLHGPDGRRVRKQGTMYHGHGVFLGDTGESSTRRLRFKKSIAPGRYRARVIVEYIEREIFFEIEAPN